MDNILKIEQHGIHIIIEPKRVETECPTIKLSYFVTFTRNRRFKKVNKYPPDAAADTKVGSTGLHFMSNTLQSHM